MRFDASACLLFSYQHWTFYPVMCVARVAQSLRLLLLSDSSACIVPCRLAELAGVAVFSAWYHQLRDSAARNSDLRRRAGVTLMAAAPAYPIAAAMDVNPVKSEGGQGRHVVARAPES
ncbi:hypothetical protein ACP70R_040385 [Stipagrostis hirtigluma subsp. patula]